MASHVSLDGNSRRARSERVHLADGDGVEFGEGAVEVPREGQAAVFVVFEALEFFDEVDFELRADPHAEFEGDILVCISAAVSAGARLESDRSGFLNPFLHTEFIAVETGLAFNCGEFAGIKIGVINGFPDAEKLDGVPISEPVRDEKIPILGLEHVSHGNEVTVWKIQNRDFCSLDLNAGFDRLFHGV